MEILFLIIGIIIGAVTVWLISSFKYKGESTRVEERSRILEDDKSSLHSELKIEREKSEKFTSENSSLKSDYSNLQTKLAEQKAEVEELQQKFTKEFENLANKIFEEKTTKFSQQSEKNLQTSETDQPKGNISQHRRVR